jgi:hypothetical protein
MMFSIPILLPAPVIPRLVEFTASEAAEVTADELLSFAYQVVYLRCYSSVENIEGLPGLKLSSCFTDGNFKPGHYATIE